MSVPTNNSQSGKSACLSYVPLTPSDRLFCSATADRTLTARDLNISTTEMDRLSTIWDGGRSFSNALMQWYGQHLCNRMIRAVEKSRNVTYDFIVRQRPDSLIMAPLPDTTSLPNSSCTVFYRDVQDYCCGNEDSFFFGKADIMHSLLDRVLDFGRVRIPDSGMTCPSVDSFTFGSPFKFVSECLNKYWLSTVCGGEMYPIRGVWQHPFRFNHDDGIYPRSSFVDNSSIPTNMFFVDNR